MPFQSEVRTDLASGMIGEAAFTGPIRDYRYILNSGSADNNVFGRVFTFTGTEGEVQAGGDIANGFAGVLVNPKEHASYGATNPLDPSMTLPNGISASIREMGNVIIPLAATADPSSTVIYTAATGVISIGTADGLTTYAVPNARILPYLGSSAAEIAVVELTN